MRTSLTVQFIDTLRMLALGAFLCGLAQSGHGQVVADFSGSPTSGAAALNVQFTDASTASGQIQSWQWDFGDGTTGVSQNPTHTYTSAGTYTVRLSVIALPIQFDTVVKQTYITVAPPTPIDTDFTVTPTSGGVPLTVQFTDTSTGNQPLAWLWDFGDGSTSSQQHPAHTYMGPGSYSVSLQTSIGDQSWSELKNDLIVVSPAPLVPQFTASPTEVIVGQPVSFFDASSGVTPTAWLWDFGDGNSSTAQDPVHVYTAPANPTVSLSVSYFEQTATAVMPALITVDPAPLMADYNVSSPSGVMPLTVSFSEASTGMTPDSWIWDFGDGSGSTDQLPMHTYTVPGTYTVSRTVTFLEQTETVVKANLIDVLYPVTLNVPGDASTIQGAIDLAADYTQILVAPGTYNEAIDFGGKTLGVVAAAGASQTVIDASGLGTRPVTISAGSGPGTILRGFHVTGGLVSNSSGGGVAVSAWSQTPPTVRIIECQISGNQAFSGGGVFGVALDTSVEDCLVTGNIATTSGGGINRCRDVKRTVVSGNVSNDLGGGLAYCRFVEDCIISENQAFEGGGAAEIFDQVRGCLFDSNTAAFAGGYYGVYSGSDYVLEDSDSQFIDNVGGSIVMYVGCYANLSDLVVVQDEGAAVSLFVDCCGASFEPKYFNGTLSRATFVGGGLGVWGNCWSQPAYGSLSVSECIISEASAPVVDSTSWGAGAIDVRYSNITVDLSTPNTVYMGKPNLAPPVQPWPGTGNINADPLFVDPDNLAYGLAPGSPCIDAGSPGSPLDDDFTIADMGALPFGRWLHLWNGLYGSHGIPLLEGAGDLTPGSETTLTLSHAREGSNATLVIGFSGISAPLKGGVLVPAPDVVLFGASVDAAGTLSLSSQWPTGVPSGITTYFQWWTNDPTSVGGFAASNALSGTTP